MSPAPFARQDHQRQPERTYFPSGPSAREEELLEAIGCARRVELLHVDEDLEHEIDELADRLACHGDQPASAIDYQAEARRRIGLDR